MNDANYTLMHPWIEIVFWRADPSSAGDLPSVLCLTPFSGVATLRSLEREAPYHGAPYHGVIGGRKQ